MPRSFVTARRRLLRKYQRHERRRRQQQRLRRRRRIRKGIIRRLETEDEERKCDDVTKRRATSPPGATSHYTKASRSSVVPLLCLAGWCVRAVRQPASQSGDRSRSLSICLVPITLNTPLPDPTSCPPKRPGLVPTPPLTPASAQPSWPAPEPRNALSVFFPRFFISCFAATTVQSHYHHHLLLLPLMWLRYSLLAH